MRTGSICAYDLRGRRPAAGSHDLVVANLPYTDAAQSTQRLPPEESLFQPGVALWAGADSLALIRRLIGQAPAGTGWRWSTRPTTRRRCTAC